MDQTGISRELISLLTQPPALAQLPGFMNSLTTSICPFFRVSPGPWSRQCCKSAFHFQFFIKLRLPGFSQLNWVIVFVHGQIHGWSEENDVFQRIVRSLWKPSAYRRNVSRGRMTSYNWSQCSPIDFGGLIASFEPSSVWHLVATKFAANSLVSICLERWICWPLKCALTGSNKTRNRDHISTQPSLSRCVQPESRLEIKRQNSK